MKLQYVHDKTVKNCQRWLMMMSSAQCVSSLPLELVTTVVTLFTVSKVLLFELKQNITIQKIRHRYIILLLFVIII